MAQVTGFKVVYMSRNSQEVIFDNLEDYKKAISIDPENVKLHRVVQTIIPIIDGELATNE